MGVWNRHEEDEDVVELIHTLMCVPSFFLVCFTSTYHNRVYSVGRKLGLVDLFQGAGLEGWPEQYITVFSCSFPR